jgi:carbamoyltransferase
MKNILGIKFGGHDTSAALLIGGKLVAACAQERYTRDKHSRLFPKEAALDCLMIAGIKIDQVDEIAFVDDLKLHIRNIYLKPAIESDERLDFLFKDIDRLKQMNDMDQIIRKNLNYKGIINYYRHHLCHVASSYYPSGFKDALCLSIDGVGESETGLIASAKSGNIKILNNENVYPHSLGLLYSAITHYLGWKHHCDEGIIMGLAPYGNSLDKVPGQKNKSYKSVFKKILTNEKDFKYKINLEYVDYYSERNKWVTDKFIKIFGPKRKWSDPLSKHHKNIAAALQDQLEHVVLNQLKVARKKFKLSKLCLSGGVALNCSLNGKIAKSKIFKEIFVQPASGDDGCTYGASLLAYAKSKKKFMPKKMHNFYKGSIFTNNQIKKEILKSNVKYECPKNLYKNVSNHLEKGKIVAWFQGGSEFGPRALGNRSILCRPYPNEMKDHLNTRVKFREEFRPFAPSVLNEYRDEFFHINQDSPHMLMACKIKKDKKKIIPAIVHVDDTCRVQTVKKDINKKFYNLINEFYKITGVPVLLNTSFNVKGQPIVNTPLEAIETFKSTNIDVLAIGDFVLSKN